MHGHTCKQQGRRVKMPQIMQPGAREQLTSPVLSHCRVVCLERFGMSEGTVSGWTGLPHPVLNAYWSLPAHCGLAVGRSSSWRTRCSAST
jgi:hypothetical protein